MQDADHPVIEPHVEDKVRADLLAGYPDFLTPADAAVITGWTVGYIRGLCRDGVIPAMKPVNDRGRWFIPKPMFIEWMGGAANE